VPAWATKSSGTFSPVFLLAFEATFFICTFFSAFTATVVFIDVFAFAFVFVRVFLATISSKKANTENFAIFGLPIRIRIGSFPDSDADADPDPARGMIIEKWFRLGFAYHVGAHTRMG
jgi:hypothetical protein